MDDAVLARTAAREALSDIEPARLHEELDDRLAEAAVTPGVLALVTTRALDPTVDLDTVSDRAAGVQLIYEGLRLTRSLAHEEPWATTTTEGEDIAADVEILAADVLVSRGFYLLARTDAAEAAVDVVRDFGRDQTLREREGADAETLDRNLEADVFELAVIAGTTAVDGAAPEDLLAYARDLAADFDGGFPPAGQAITEGTADRIATLSGDGA